MSKKSNLNLIIVAGAFFLFSPIFVSAISIGEKIKFFVDPSYDLQDRQEITASLEKVSDRLYFYIDDNWLMSQAPQTKANIAEVLNNLALEFEARIYPTLTAAFGTERRPGIDNDERITVLLFPMKNNAGGYFNNGDEYSRIQIPRSNQREMIYLNTALIENPNAKSALAHEFTHLITFNQKEFIRNTIEETWLNEIYSEFSSNLLGYNDVYSGSLLQNRIKTFLEKPGDSLTEWLGEIHDYGVVNVFMQYLTDHYGNQILIDSMHTLKSGIPSINEVLRKNGFAEDFNQIFTDWTVAVLINDCSLGQKYCYLNKNLSTLRITPVLNFLPLSSDSSLSVTHKTTNWAGNWQKITGGRGSLTFEFDGTDNIIFRVPYLLCESSGKCSVNFFALDTDQKGKINLDEFGQKYTSLVLVPSVQNKIVGFNGIEPSYIFTWVASTKTESGTSNEEEIKIKLLAQIDLLQKQIAVLQAQINAILGGGGQTLTCGRFEKDLYFGLENNADVSCLQQFLKSKGVIIYPEGQVTGNFFSATKAAVIRYQASKGIIQTGYFGPLTRSAVNTEI